MMPLLPATLLLRPFKVLCKGPKLLERVPRLLESARLLVRVFLKVREEGGGREEEAGLETTAYKSPEAGCRCQWQFQKIFNLEIAFHQLSRGSHLVEGGGVWGDAENASTSAKRRSYGSSGKMYYGLGRGAALP